MKLRIKSAKRGRVGWCLTSYDNPKCKTECLTKDPLHSWIHKPINGIDYSSYSDKKQDSWKPYIPLNPAFNKNPLKTQKKRVGVMIFRKADGIRYGAQLNDPSVESVQAKNPNPL
jgi:hypothetical protein